jgi:tetratricopeptide (TPR) repeat protein
MKSFRSVLPRLYLIAPVLLLAACGSPEERAQGYYDRGIALIEKKDDLAARLELLNAVKFKSDKIEAWRALAGIDERTTAYQALFNDLRRIVELDPADVAARTKLANMLLAGGATEAALRIVEGAGDSANQNAGLLSLKAAILLKMRDTTGGLVEARKATEIDPGDVDAAIMLASERFLKGDSDGAMRILSAPTIASKNDFRVDQMRVQIFVQKGELTQAESLLRKLIDQQPNNISSREQLARVLMAQRKFDDVEKELRFIATANPTNTGAELNVVRFLNAVKGSSAARQELVLRINAGGDVFAYQMALADLDFAQGKFADSVALLEGLITAPNMPEHSLAARTKLAEFYFRKADYLAAEKLVGEILQKDPRNIAGLKIRASIRIEQKQFENAIADLREALNGQPKSPELLLLLALAYERDAKLELADRQYAEATKSAPKNPNVGLQYVAFLQRQGRIEQAENVLTETASANPKSIDVLGALAQIRLARQNWEGALTAADSIQSVGNDHGVANLIRGAAFAGQNKMEQSVAALEAAHASAPDAVQPTVSLVNAYVRIGKSEKAVALLKDLLKKYPETSQLYLLLGNTFLAKNNFEEATSSFKAAIAQRPKEPGGYDALWNLYTRQKKYDEASKIMQEGLREQPDNLNFKLAVAGTMLESGDQDGAIKQYESILKDTSNVLVAINNLASLLLDYRTDKESLDRAYALAEGLKNSTVPQFQDTVGWAQYQRGDYKSAIATLEGAQAKLPNLGSIRYHLGMSYSAAGQSEKASEQLKAALQLEPEGSPLRDKIKAALK